jgi:hypothetical protein
LKQNLSIIFFRLNVLGLSLLAWLFCSCIEPARAQAPAVKTLAQPAEIKITSTVIKTIDPELFLGVNWEFTARTHSMREIFKNYRREFANFLSAHGVRVLRYITEDWLFPGVPSEKWLHEFQVRSKAPVRQDDWIEVSEFLGFLQEGNFKGIFQINTHQYWDQEHKQVRSVKGPQGLAIDRVVESAERLVKLLPLKAGEYYIEIGNEDWDFYTPEQYAAIAYQIMSTLKRGIPGIKIIITGQSHGGPNIKANTRLLSWTEKVLQSLSAKGAQGWVDYIAHHDYANVLLPGPGAMPDNISISRPEEEWQRYLAYDSTTDSGWKHFLKMYPVGISLDKSPITLLNELLQKYGYQHTKIWITEFRNGWMTNRFSKALAGGLGNLNLLIHYLNSAPIAGAVIHSITHGSRVSLQEKRPFLLWGFGIMEYAPNLEQKFIATPDLQALSLLSHVLKGNEVLKTETSDQQLSLACVRKGNNYYLLVINMDLNDQHQAYLCLPAASWHASGQRLILTSKNIGDYAVVYGSFDKVSPISISQNSFSASPTSVVSFPPHSATVLELQVHSK